MAGTQKEILSIRELRIGYTSGKRENILLPPLNAIAGRGEMIALIGRNGIGKSTLLRTIAGLQSPLGGEVIIDGQDLKSYRRLQLALKIGYISTEPVRVTNMTVYDLVSLGRFPYMNWSGKIEPDDHLEIMNALRMTSMKELEKRYVSELSDGERQRAMIARLMAQNTGIMIMDEPTAFLDIGSKYEIIHLMHRLSRENGKTIVFSTHDLNIALSLADRIWLIHGDRLDEGAPEDLMIEGAFEHLFDTFPVEFNPSDGSFSMRSTIKGEISLEGTGIIRHWAEKAVRRAGYIPVEEKTLPCIKLPDPENSDYLLITPGAARKFTTLYELVGYLIETKVTF